MLTSLADPSPSHPFTLPCRQRQPLCVDLADGGTSQRSGVCVWKEVGVEEKRRGWICIAENGLLDLTWHLSVCAYTNTQWYVPTMAW